MSWRIVMVSSLSKLDYKMDYLVVRNREGATRIHLSEISILLLESTAISLTAYLLRELDRHKVDVIFCDEKRLPYRYMRLIVFFDLPMESGRDRREYRSSCGSLVSDWTAPGWTPLNCCWSGC